MISRFPFFDDSNVAGVSNTAAVSLQPGWQEKLLRLPTSRSRILALIAIVLLHLIPTTGYAEEALETWAKGYMQWTDIFPEMVAGTDLVIKDNAVGEKELFIANEKKWSVLVRIYDDNHALIAEKIVIPRTRTMIGDIVDLIENPLMVDYQAYLDGTFMSALTPTGLTASNAPPVGSVDFVLGSKKALTASIICAIGSLLDVGVDLLAIVVPENLDKTGFLYFIRTAFISEALHDPELLTNVGILIPGIIEGQTIQERENALSNIAGVYADWAIIKLETIWAKYLTKTFLEPQFQMTDAMKTGFNKAFVQLKALRTLSKIGGVAAAISAITAEMKRGNERVYAIQLFQNHSTARPKLAVDVPPNSLLGNGIEYLLMQGVTEVTSLLDDNGYLHQQDAITTAEFEGLVNGVNRSVTKAASAPGMLYAWLPSAYPTRLDTLDAMYMIYEKLYPVSLQSMTICALGNNINLTRVKRKYFFDNEFIDIKNNYSIGYALKAYAVVPVISHRDIFLPAEHLLTDTLTKAEAIYLMYDLAFFHSTRSSQESDPVN